MKFLFYFILAIFCSSCLPNFRMSGKKVSKYYVKSSSKPSFAYTNTSKNEIFYAYSADSTKPILLLIHGAPGAWFGY